MTDIHQIFTICRCSIIDYGSDLFATAKGDSKANYILASKLAKSAYSPSFVALAFGNELQYRTSDFKLFIYDDLATSYKHFVNFGPVTPAFKRVISNLATFALLLNLAGISNEFSWAITTQFCFTYTLEGVTAMPRGLHARLSHVFLVPPHLPRASALHGKHANTDFQSNVMITAFLDFDQSPLFNLVDSQLILTLLFDSLNCSQ